MTREQAEQIARSVLTAVNADTSWPSVNHVADAIMEVADAIMEVADAIMEVADAIMETAAVERADEREACANIVADAAPGFCGGRAETVLYSVAETIRARGEQHRQLIGPTEPKCDDDGGAP